MDENEKKEPETAQGSPKPEDYSRYMGTLNRIYRRGNNPRAKKLDSGIDSLKKGAAAPQPAPANGKKDRSFWVTLATILVAALVIWLVKSFLL